MKVKVRLSSGKEYKHNIEVNYYSNDDYYEIKCVASNGEVMGFLTYKINMTSFGLKKVWMYKIETNKKHSHNGVGTALIYVFEYKLAEQNISYVEAKYYPENNAAVKFYEKYGYQIDREDYETYITKTIRKEEIDKNILPSICDKSEEMSL